MFNVRLSKTNDLDDKFANRRFPNLGLNQQLYDMGIPRGDLQNTVLVKQRILQADKEFDLVMIAEKFEESLVLLAESLCWPLEYLTSLKHNVRRRDVKVCTFIFLLRVFICFSIAFYNLNIIINQLHRSNLQTDNYH